MRLFTSLLLLTFHFIVFGQTTIKGKVKDAKGAPVTGVSIAIKDSYDGGTTDSSGNFNFKTTEKGIQTLVATSIGYKSIEQKVDLATASLTIDFLLKEDINELKAVVISAGAFEASDSKKTTVLNSIDIVTTASANADITGALKTLPGTQQVGESEGLFVRGGTAAETKTFIDGTLVNNFFYSSVPGIAQRGRFSPFIFKGTVFSTGGYSALYGQALSSALILESIDLPDRSSANLGVSVLGASGGFQQLAKNKKSSWGIDYGYTDLSLAFVVLKQKQDYFTIPAYHTADANFRIKTSGTGIIKYYGYMSANKLGFRQLSIDTLGYKDAFGLSNFNMYHNLSYRESLGKGWKINTGISYTNNKDHINGNLQDEKNDEVMVNNLEYKNFSLNSKSDYANGKIVFEKRLSGLSALRMGSEYNYSNERPVYTLYNGQQYTQGTKEKIGAAFAETDIYVTNNIAAKIGTRLEHSSLIEKINIAPRISLAYKLSNESQASLAYGIFYQDPETKYLPASALNFTRATHYIAQYQKISNNRTLRVEAVYKKYNQLLKTTLQNNRETAVNNNGYGYAQGLDFFWRDKQTFKNFDYWISYSYLDTQRDFLNYPFRLEPPFASKHTASLVLKKFVSAIKTQFNASYTYATGRPYYNISYYNSGSAKIFDSGKTIDYNSLSLSVNYLPNIGKTGSNKFTVFVFSVTNVLNSQQIYGYRYSFNNIRKEAVVPPSRMFAFIGAFISFGVDRSQDVINSNL